MIAKVRLAGYRIEEVPIRFADRLHGKSKLNLWIEAPKFFLALIPLVFRLRVLMRS